jgi:hypothetical protein
MVGELERLQETVRRLEVEANTLQARLRVRESLDAQRASQREASARADEPSGGRTLAAIAPAAPSVPSGRQRRGIAPRGEPQDDLTSSSRGARTTAAVSATPTVEAALDRFYRYLGETSGPGGQPRWQKLRELAADLRAMGDVGTDALLRVLGTGSASSDARRAAAQLAGELQLPQAQPLLQDILANDSDVLLRRAAASALRRLDTPDAVPAMETLLANPAEDRFVRMSAAYGLAQQGNPQGVNGLMQIFEESNADGRGREMAFRALTSLEDDRSLPFMRSLVTSNVEPAYRLQAIRFLTAQGDRQALGALQQIAQSPIEQPSIHDAAVQAVAALTGR